MGTYGREMELTVNTGRLRAVREPSTDTPCTPERVGDGNMQQGPELTVNAKRLRAVREPLTVIPRSERVSDGNTQRGAELTVNTEY